MSFKNSFTLTAGFCAILTSVLLGCDAKLGETAPAPEVREFKSAECLSTTMPTIKTFFKGEASDTDVLNTWDCIGTAISQFRRYVRSRESEDRYTPQEMATYLENNFLKDDGRKISPALQAEVMKVKRMLVGGDPNFLTMSDLDRMTSMVVQLRKMSLAMNPYMKVFSQNWQPQAPLNSAANLDFFERANSQIQDFAREFNAIGLQSYRIADAVALVRELGIFVDPNGHDEMAKQVARYIPLVQKLKKALAGGDETRVETAEWRNMLFGASRGYVQVLRYQYFLQSAPDTVSDVRLSFITRLLEDSFSTLGDLVAQKSTHQIPQGELNDVLVEASKVWPTFKVSNQLVPQILKLKQVLFGGDLNAIALADLQRAQPKLGLVQSLALQILPYYNIYAGDWHPNAADMDGSHKLFLAGQEELVSALGSFGQIFETDFDLNELPAMVHELLASYPGLASDPGEVEKVVRQYLPTVIQVKNISLGQTGSVVRKEDWSKLLPLLGSAYGDYLYYHYFFTDGDLSKPENLETLQHLGTQTLATVDRMLQGRQPQQISKAEVSDLLSSLSKAWPDLKVSDVLVSEAMKVKALLFGGSDGFLTSADVQRAQAKLPAIKSILLKVWPYYDVYAQNWDPQSSSDEKAEAYLNEAKVVLADALRDVAALAESPYDVNRLPILVREALSLYPNLSQDPVALRKMVEGYAPLIVDLKNMIFAENDSLMKKPQWDTFLSLGGEAYSAYLYQFYFVKGHGVETQPALLRLENVGDQFFAFGAHLLQVKKTHMLSIGEIKRLVDRIVPLNILPEELDASTLRGVVGVVANRLLVSPDQRIAGHLPQAVNQHSLDMAQLEFKNWIELEQFTAGFFPKGSETYSPSQAKRLYQDRYKQRGLTQAVNAGLKEMVMALDTPIPLALDSKSRLIIEDRDRPYNRKALAQVNIDRMIVRLFFRSYVTDLGRLRNYRGLTLSESQTAYGELKPIAVKMGLIDAQNTTFASSRFREANMFVPRANGDNLVSFQEGVDLVAMIASGLNINSMFKAELQKSCLRQGRGQSDTLVDKDCLTRVYMRQMPFYMSSMPYFAGFIRGASDEERAVYFENVLKAAGYIPRGDNFVRMGEISLLPHVVQYIEMNFTKYDHDRNWIIDVHEAMEAFPCFRNVIKEVAKGQVGDDELDDLFTYILRYGKPPETVQEKLSYALNWRNKPERWVVEAGRVTLAKILGYIADQTNKPSVPAVTYGQ